MYLNIYQFSEPDESGGYYQPLTQVAICDTFTSLIWDVEYYECGVFEVYIGASPESVRIFRRGRVVGRSDDTKNYGIIEQVKLETDAENGDYLTVKGRFLMSLLERRIIYPTMTFTAMRRDRADRRPEKLHQGVGIFFRESDSVAGSGNSVRGLLGDQERPAGQL